MEKKNTLLLTVIAIATLLVAVVGATFAYFATVTDTNNTTNVTSNFEGTPATLTSGSGTPLVLNTLAGDMIQSDAGDAVVAADSSICTGCSDGTISLTLSTFEQKTKVSCKYDVVFEWLSENGYTAHTAGVTGNEFTLTLKEGSNVVLSETDIAVLADTNNSTTYTPTTGDGYKLNGATQQEIKSDNGADVTKTYTLNAKFYNVNADQSALQNLSMTGILRISDISC